MKNKKEEKQIIWIIEDDTAWQSSLVSLLSRLGYDTISTFDYGETITTLNRLKEMPILAIVDLQLSYSKGAHEFDGLEVLKLLREHNIYVLIISAFSREHADILADYIEVRNIIDKIRFTDEGYEAFFIEKLKTAVDYALAARETEGQTAVQQARLDNLPLKPKPY